MSAPDISIRERIAVDRVLRSGHLTQGKEVQKFESHFSNFLAGRPCVAVNSGTSALLLALLTVRDILGGEVIVPSFSFAATANTVVLSGAKPVFADIELDTFNIDPHSIRSLITTKTVAIQPVHLYGLPANMNEILGIAKEFGLAVLEDAAQAHLAEINEKRVGTFGSAASFSFYPTKNMTSGEGGMIAFDSDEDARIARLLRNQGMEKKYENELVGYNCRLSDIHAAIGCVQLERLAKWTDKRIKNANFMSEGLTGVIIPKVPSGYKHVFHQYTIRIPDGSRDRFAEELQKKGIQTGVYYPKPIHQLSSYSSDLDLPNTRKACKEVLSLPVHPGLTKKDLESIVDNVNLIARAGS